MRFVDVSGVVCQEAALPRVRRAVNRVLKSYAVRWIALVALLLASAAATAAQDTGTISGQVLDAKGGAVADAVVTVRNVDTGVERSAVADGHGRYEIHGLQPGQYEVKGARQGFNEQTRTGINLAVGQALTSDLKLQPKAADVCASGREFATSDCALSFHGVTLYGAYDIGLGWVSHGLPVNGYNYEGESLVNRNANHSRFLPAPNNLQQTGLGVRAKENIGHGWSVVFNANTGINPNSGLLANASLTDIQNNGLPRASYSEAIDGARAGQPFNDEFYAGVANEMFGQLTFGRQRSLGTDVMLQYDPAGGSYAFSYIGYNGTMAGGGDTEDTRWNDALKYKLTYGPVHFGAMYKFVDGIGGCFSSEAGFTAANCTPEKPHNNAWGFDLGGEYKHFSADAVYQRYKQAISVLNPLQGPQSQAPGAQLQSTTDSINTTYITGVNLIDPANTVYGIVTDNHAFLVAGKYAWNPFKFYAGYEYIWQNNPQYPLGIGADDQGGYLMSGVEDNNLDSQKQVLIWWGGAKYAFDKKTDITLGWYQQRQNTFRRPAVCVPGNMRSSCAGTLDEVSLYVDHHFTPRFDAFAGIAYSYVTGGLDIALPHGPGVPYNFPDNFAPTIGGRFAF
jgi:predicted porin